MRSRLPWVLAAPLIAGGSIAAHAAASALAGGHADEHVAAAAGAVERAGTRADLTSGGGLLPPLAGLALALLVVWACQRLGRARSRGAGPAWFLALPLAGWCLQEAFELLVGSESSPFSTLVEPHFLLGLALQLPFAIAAYLVARAFVAVARKLVARRTAPPPASRPRRVRPLPSLVSCELPRIAVLAAGWTGRGPPLPAA